MSKTAAIAFAPSPTLLIHLLAAADRWLLTFAYMTTRNGYIRRYDVLYA